MAVCGFQTLPFYADGKRAGFYLHSLVDVKRQDVPFSRQFPDHNEVIPNIFSTVGIDILKASRTYENRVMILDEIGYLEQTEPRYIEELLYTIKIFPNMLGVLRKCELQYIRQIASMPDVTVFDLDVLPYEKVRQAIQTMWRQESKADEG